MQARSLFCALTVAMLGLVAPVPAQQEQYPDCSLHDHQTRVQATNSPSDNLKAVFARMDKTSTEFRSAEANFEWDQYTRVIDETDKQEGKVYFRKVGREVEMAAHVTAPPAGEKGDKKAAASSTEKFVLFSGGKAQLYQPSTDHLDIYGTGKNNDAVESFLVLGFGGSSRDMLKSFDVTYGGHEKVDGADTDRLELDPKTEKVRSIFNHIELWIDSRGISVQQKLISPEGDYRLNKYSDVVLDQRIPDSVFRLKTNGKTTIESH